MSCKRCDSDRLLDVTVKGSDRFAWGLVIGDEYHDADGELPRDFGLDGGDYLRMTVCLDCGQLEGTWPLEETEMEAKHKQR